MIKTKSVFGGASRTPLRLHSRTSQGAGFRGTRMHNGRLHSRTSQGAGFRGTRMHNGNGSGSVEAAPPIVLPPGLVWWGRELEWKLHQTR